MSDNYREGRRLILDALAQAVAEAEARFNGLGMTNTHGLTPLERANLDNEYEKAHQALIAARKAMTEYFAAP